MTDLKKFICSTKSFVLTLDFQHFSYVRFFELRRPIDLQPPFSNMTIAQSVYLLATARCKTDSPSSSTALGSAPANSNSCEHQQRFERKLRWKLLNKEIKKDNHQKLLIMKTYTHAIRLAMESTNMSNRWTKAFSQTSINISRSFYESTDAFWGSSS